jgi:hypothetical protein
MSRRVLVLVVAVASMATLGLGCAGGGEEAADILPAIQLADAAGFHAMDEALNGSTPVINPQWAGVTRRARIAVAASEWPDELRDEATAFTAAAARLQTALEADNVAEAKGASHDAHETQHALSDAAYRILATKAGIAMPAPAAGH